MGRTASEVINNLEMRVARLESRIFDSLNYDSVLVAQHFLIERYSQFGYLNAQNTLKSAGLEFEWDAHQGIITIEVTNKRELKALAKVLNEEWGYDRRGGGFTHSGMVMFGFKLYPNGFGGEQIKITIKDI
tara:strand:- start:867 stop:1259 length:393 start_codon:yes stop_codon:yes gene_type:complete